MAKLDDRKVVVHNDLITNVVSKMDIVPLKIFELIVSSVDTENPPNDCKLYLSKQEIYSFFNATDTNRSNRFRDHFINLHRQTIFETTKDKDGKKKHRVISPFRVTEWHEDDNYDTVSILVEESFLPYLINLKENFTQYMISDIGKFKRKHSITLYRWLMMNYNKFKRYGNIKLKNPSITVNELRILTDTSKIYKKWQNFEQRVIIDSINEINEFTHLNISYESIRKGRSVKEIQFFIQSKKDKEEYINQKTEMYEEREMNYTQLLNNTLSDALQSEYVAYLIEKGIIKFNDVDSLVRAYNELIPYYRDICRLKPNAKDPLEPFRKHINYVAEHIVGTDKKFTNIINYLKECAERYLDKLETAEGQGSLFR